MLRPIASSARTVLTGTRVPWNVSLPKQTRGSATRCLPTSMGSLISPWVEYSISHRLWKGVHTERPTLTMVSVWAV